MKSYTSRSIVFPPASIALPAAGLLLLGACEPEVDEPVPDASVVEAYYAEGGDFRVEISGNVAQVRHHIPPAQLERGATLWYQAAPFVVLFSEETRDLFYGEPGLAGVRVISETAEGEVVAQALLHRDALNEMTWRRALNIAGTARTEGAEDPETIRELVRWGERHTEFEYNPDRIP